MSIGGRYSGSVGALGAALTLGRGLWSVAVAADVQTGAGGVGTHHVVVIIAPAVHAYPLHSIRHYPYIIVVIPYT